MNFTEILRREWQSHTTQAIKGRINMNKEAFTNKTREELISGAIREFKSVIDFYRMEYSENLILLFNDLGYLLLCRLIHEYGTIKKWKRDNSDFRREGDSLGVKDFSLQSAEEITSYLNKLEYNFRVATEYEDQLAFLKNYKLTIKKNSVMRPILEIVNELYELQDRSGGTDLLYDAVQRILELCINNKAEKSRYILPDEIIKYLAQILDAERKFTNTDRKVSILDPQYSSGNMLTAASGYFKNSQLYGFESDNSLKISAQILFILANIDVNTGEENFLTNRLEKRYDIVLANPSFTNDPVPENSNVYEPPLPEELGHINGKYNAVFNLLCFPYSLMNAQILMAVEIIHTVIWIQMVFHPVKYESGIGYTVGIGSDNRSEEAAIYKIFGQLIIAKNHISCFAFFVRHD